MKKRNKIKKLLSVILAATMLFSMMTIPSYAVVPGEDSYGGESTFVRYNFNTGITEYIQVPKESASSGTSTNSFLTEAELALVPRDAEISGLIGDTDDRERVPVNTDPYSGIVLIVLECDTNDDGIPDCAETTTGFMISERVMLTALHCFNPDSNYQYDYAIISTKIYQGVSVGYTYDVEKGPLSIIDCLDAYENNWDELESIAYDPQFFTSNRDPNYDWCIATLEDGFDCYYFQVEEATASLTNQTVTVAGYPSDDSFFIRKASGIAGYFNESGNLLAHYVDTFGGQSGAPLYAETNTGRVCYGIHIGGVANNPGDVVYNYNNARVITGDLLNMINIEKNKATGGAT